MDVCQPRPNPDMLEYLNLAFLSTRSTLTFNVVLIINLGSNNLVNFNPAVFATWTARTFDIMLASMLVGDLLAVIAETALILYPICTGAVYAAFLPWRHLQLQHS